MIKSPVLLYRAFLLNTMSNFALLTAIRKHPLLGNYHQKFHAKVCGTVCKLINRVPEYHNRKIVKCKVLNEDPNMPIQITFDSRPNPVEDLIMHIN